MSTRHSGLLLTLFLAVCAAAQDACLECHALLDGYLQTPAAVYKDDIHQRRGFGCASCHGGDPTSNDKTIAKRPGSGFRGKIARTAVPKLCAQCHSDARLMHKFNPKAHVDQYEQYVTSVHGQRILKGDEKVANCVDCHSVHDIRDVKSPLTPVHPLRLPQTCARCHADSAHMAEYTIPTDQYESYTQSVHWEALAKRGDLSAPSCASCHGNHGAAPPGVESVSAVCGTCHVLMEDLFNKSPHEPVFTAMGLGECIICHESHGVMRTSVDMLDGDANVCASCHTPDSTGGQAAEAMGGAIRNLMGALDRSDTVLRRAQGAGMEVSQAFVRQQEAREALIMARVAVHAFAVDAVNKPVEDGLEIAAETYQAGVDALAERDRRRIGLGVSLVAILLTLIGIRMAIRYIERPQSG